MPIISLTVPPLFVGNHTPIIRIEANKSFGIGALCDACTCVLVEDVTCVDCLSDAEDSSRSEGCLDHVFVGELLFAMNVLF